MKKTLAVFAVVLSLGMTAALDAEAARRLGGGKSSGMQRQTTTQPAQQPGAPANTATNQAPTAANAAAPAAATAAATQKRSWMGPIAGLAAGLGLAALASHLGFGEELANMLMIGLLVMAVLAVIGLVMRKRAAGGSPAFAGGMDQPQGMQRSASPADMQRSSAPEGGSRIGSLIGSRVGSGIGSGLAGGATATAGGIPADFDAESFVRNAKSNFLALQAANDAGDLGQLREYLTPGMFEAVREDIATRGNTPQKTEVFGLQGQVLEVAQDDAQYVVSVRFTGSIRHEAGAPIEDLAEVWHLVKPRTGAGGWVIAGIQQG